MKVGDLIEKLRRYPKDAMNKKSSLSKEKRDAVLDAVNLLRNTCEGTLCSKCVLLDNDGDCILKVSLPYSWDLKTVEQNCKGE